MNNHRTAVYIFGCHLQLQLQGSSWERAVWGDADAGNPATLQGRGVMGVFTALVHGADTLLFSTGASERNGIKEARYTRDFLLERVESLETLFKSKGYDFSASTITNLLENALLDEETQNTREESRRNIPLLAQLGATRIILISSPWHIQRCLTEALTALEEVQLKGVVALPEVLAKASEGSTENIRIVEPAHRGDRSMHHFNTLVHRFFKVAPERISTFEAELDTLLTHYDV